MSVAFGMGMDIIRALNTYVWACMYDILYMCAQYTYSIPDMSSTDPLRSGKCSTPTIIYCTVLPMLCCAVLCAVLYIRAVAVHTYCVLYKGIWIHTRDDRCVYTACDDTCSTVRSIYRHGCILTSLIHTVQPINQSIRNQFKHQAPVNWTHNHRQLQQSTYIHTYIHIRYPNNGPHYRVLPTYIPKLIDR